MTKDLIWIEVSKKAISHNFKQLKKAVGSGVLISAAVKANAYGHGLVETSKALVKAGADWLCVNSIEEAEILRKSEIKKPILIMGFVQKKDLPRVVAIGAGMFLCDISFAKALSLAATKAGKKIPVFIKIDTGLSRLGIMPSEVLPFAKSLAKLQGLKLEGVATHFAVDDNGEDEGYFRKQMAKFKEVIEELKKSGFSNLLISGSSSATAFLSSDHGFDIIRVGIGIYGYHSSKHVEKFCRSFKGIVLEPALSLKTKVAQVKDVPKDVCVSYGCDFVTKKKTKIAILPIGYYDGIDRKLGGRGHVLIRGKKAPIIGRVCMNMIMVDVSGIDGVKTGDEAVLIGKQGKNRITADELAKWADTINYEILAKLREGIVRKYI